MSDGTIDADVRVPDVEGPVTAGRGPVLAGTTFDLAAHGYREAEYFISGHACAYAADDATGTVAPHADAAYRTRVIVYRPEDPAAFDGTVVVEWLNVSGGLDAAPDWLFLHRELMRAGSAYVGVSAQAVGVIGGPSLMGMPGAALVDTDPERYGSLVHPGDRFSYDIFTQAGALARAGAGTILDGLAVERVIAVGESQSAFRLTTYVNHVDPLARVFDGFLVHARGGGGAPLDDDGPAIGDGAAAPFRDDLRVPVLCVEAETDLVTLGYLVARQDDTDRFRLWELAGCSHADVYVLSAGPLDSGTVPIEELAAAWRPSRTPLGSELAHPINAGPQRYVVAAAMRHLDRWVRDGTLPPSAPRLDMTAAAAAPELVLDEHGNATGGVRTPHVDVPVAVLSGLGNEGGPIAMLSGSTLPFTPEQLAARYPTEDDYVRAFRASTEATVAAGFFLPEDADEIVAVAAHNFPA